MAGKVSTAPRSPRYATVMRRLRNAIASGRYGAGEQIPTEHAMIRSFRVSITTVRKAVEELCREGLLVKRQGLGTFVTQRCRRVGVVCPYPSASWVAMHESLHTGLRKLGISLRTHHYVWLEAAAFAEDLADAAAESDAVVVFPPYRLTEPDVAALVKVADASAPLVILDRVIPELAGRASLATIDYESGFQRLITMLCRTRRRIAVLVDPAHPACAGLRSAAVASGVGERVVEGPFFQDDASVFAALNSLFAGRPGPDGVVAPSSKIALSVHAVLSARGLSPEAVEVAAAGELPLLQSVGRSMWALDLRRGELGERLAGLVARLLQGDKAPARLIVEPGVVYLDAERLLSVKTA
ncbi:MAG: hypothetical protein A3K19_32340 [Lentisphaerae bacterium RIFOXYB12_FULL_65_16]|nr:MAG: hypothetical protein A3K18_13140 [Lentisphaerae bacterium RIFOXYA12_64_32]OGV85709.1 MAG: hypothetical protein A3K19_32340 [Lentisphaerae bacterium RIFOXYB12_FULL_65_16]